MGLYKLVHFLRNYPTLTMNASAPFGEIRYQLTDLESQPVDGYTFVQPRWFYTGGDERNRVKRRSAPRSAG